jgi:hypothetical protein
VGETITYTASPVSNENHQVRDEQDGDDHSKNGRSRKREKTTRKLETEHNN